MLRSLTMAFASLLTANLALGQSAAPTADAVQSAQPRPRTRVATGPRRSEAKTKNAATAAPQKQSADKPAAETPQQVVVRLTIAELSRHELRGMQTVVEGVDVQELAAVGMKSLLTDWSLNVNEQHVRPTDARKGKANDTVCHCVLDDARPLNQLLTEFRRLGVLHVVADPTLATICGRRAFLRIGGEVPAPSTPVGSEAADASATQIGAQVACSPTALGADRVRLAIRARVAELDEKAMTEVKGAPTPAVRVQELETSVEMQFGHTLVLAGLMQQRTEGDGFAEAREASETELVEMVVTVRCELADVAHMASRATSPK